MAEFPTWAGFSKFLGLFLGLLGFAWLLYAETDTQPIIIPWSARMRQGEVGCVKCQEGLISSAHTLSCLKRQIARPAQSRLVIVLRANCVIEGKSCSLCGSASAVKCSSQGGVDSELIGPLQSVMAAAVFTSARPPPPFPCRIRDQEPRR